MTVQALAGSFWTPHRQCRCSPKDPCSALTSPARQMSEIVFVVWVVPNAPFSTPVATPACLRPPSSSSAGSNPPPARKSGFCADNFFWTSFFRSDQCLAGICQHITPIISVFHGTSVVRRCPHVLFLRPPNAIYFLHLRVHLVQLPVVTAVTAATFDCRSNCWNIKIPSQNPPAPGQKCRDHQVSVSFR